MAKIKNIFFLLILFTTCYLLPTTCSLFAQDKMIAIVNNEVITQKDLDDFANFMRMQMGGKRPPKSELLDQLIEDRLILWEAKNNHITVDENRVKGKINDIRKQYSSDAQFQEALKAQGMVQADLEARLREQFTMYGIIDLKVRRKIVINPVEVTDYYQKNIEQFKSPAIWEFDALALQDRDLAFELSGNLKRGQSMEDLANKYSLGINKLNMKKGEFKREVEAIVFRLKPQGISDPVKIEDKYYIFRLNNITPEHQQTLSEAQDGIFNFLYNKKMQEDMARWLDGLKERSYIKIINE